MRIAAVRPGASKWLPAAGVLLLAVASLAVASDRAETGVLRIGLLLSTNRLEAASLRNGATLGIKHVNRALAIPATLVVRDRSGQWGTEGNEAAELALDEDVHGLITPPDGAAAHQILQVAGRTRLPVISLCPDSSVTSAGVPWAARIVPQTGDEARAIFEDQSSVSAASAPLCWAAIVPSGRAGREAAGDLKAAAASAERLLIEPVQVDGAGTAPAVAHVLALNPQGILLWTTPAVAAECALQLRRAGFKGLLAGPDTLDSPAFLRIAGDAANGCVVPALAGAPGGGTRLMSDFEREYRARFGTEPDTAAVMAHDAVLVLANVPPGWQSGQRTPPFLTRLEGASGTVEFDSSGNRVAPLQLLVCDSGVFRSSTRSPRQGQGRPL